MKSFITELKLLRSQSKIGNHIFLWITKNWASLFNVPKLSHGIFNISLIFWCFQVTHPQKFLKLHRTRSRMSEIIRLCNNKVQAYQVSRKYVYISDIIWIESQYFLLNNYLAHKLVVISSRICCKYTMPKYSHKSNVFHLITFFQKPRCIITLASVECITMNVYCITMNV